MELRRDHQFDPFSFDEQFQGRGDDLDFSQMDFNDPATMSKILGMDVPHKLPAEVRRDAQQLSISVLSTYERLQAIVKRHEAVVQQQWLKKKKQQRLAILRSAWGPGMPSIHRPDFEAFRRQSGQHMRGSTDYRTSFIWPYINEEDLVKPKALLLFLNARAYHHPSEFAGADYEAMHLGLVTKNVVPVFLNEYVMILQVSSNVREYGKLLAWSEHPDAFEWMHTRKQFLPGEGLLVLEAQQKTLSFLVNCCQNILHDIPSSDLTADTFPPQPVPYLKSEKEKDGFESLAVMAAEAPYRLPARIDWDRICSVLQAKMMAAGDHIWALREDPGYFAEQLADVKEHRQEILKDTNGDVHPTLGRLRPINLWARVTGETVFEAYYEYEVYTELHRLAKQLRETHSAHAASISPEKDLPDEFLDALLKFRHYLSQAAKGPLNQLKQSVVASPPMRKFYVRDPPISADSTKIFIRSRTDVKMTKVESQLTWLLRILWEDGTDLFLMSMPLALDELDRLLQAEPEAKDLVTGRIASMIGNLSIIAQCFSQLELYQPWARSFKSHLVERNDGIMKEFAERTSPWGKMMAVMSESNIQHIVKLADPPNHKFSYPSERRRTKENTKLLIQAENNLDKFWAAVDRHMRSRLGDQLGIAVKRLLSQQRGLQRTPEWVEAPVTLKNKQKQEQSLDVQLDSIYKPLSTLYFGESGDKRGDAVQPDAPFKVKEKTRGVATKKTLVATEAGQSTGVSDASGAVSIPVDARSFKVFRTLFYDPDVTSHPGEVSWKDFLHAMTSTGIFAAEKLYGSVWQFQRVDGLDQSRIQFHEPHPHGKIPFVVAKRHGRRLNRNYGWTGDMFTLKGSEKHEAT
ncbi:uncharacterized protein CTRU02_214941 [Colletotrichum truncatum]|uniref:Uncharacterized protein n=1 Tax=Colletotrichum truncatum TaxID=5467 RepID=A0ACC3YE89_COLTU|nr:uncharacterized protein CTRU02_08307 [Colletotrichum truncatum]KAF6790178.1 hypothetical protein CTRU02_08307 [Colletotrichum truncatum]